MKILLYLSMILLITSTCIFCSSEPDHFVRGKIAMEKQMLELAKKEFSLVLSEDKNYDSANIYLENVDNMIKLIEAEEAAKELESQIEVAKKNIELIKNFDGNIYRADVNALLLEVSILNELGNYAAKAQKSEDQTLMKLGKSIEANLITLQKKEYPIMRKVYATLVNNILWEQNITVKYGGAGNTTLSLVGVIYANNKNKKDTQEAISSIVHELRFKKVTYKWIEHDDEYTYYTINSLNDSEIATP